MHTYTRRRFCVLGGGTVLSMWPHGDKAQGNRLRFSGAQGRYTNPIIPGDHPDAGAIRVGNDYYITHTSFRYTPGLVIWHSRNLIDWVPISAALHRYIGDVWAPYLCQHQNQFLIYFPVNGHLFVVHSSTPHGPWCDPIDLKLPGIDPAYLATPDGRTYLYVAGGDMVELSADGLSAKGTFHKAFEAWPIPDDWQVQCECLEAPKIFLRDGYYYLTVAEGGTSGPPTSHMVISMRSKDPHGPWQLSPHNPILHTASKDDYWWSVGHGRLVEAVDGSWWMTCHGYENGYRTLGRQNLLFPVEWTSDGWYRVTADLTNSAPIPIASEVIGKRPDLSDDFSEEKLRPQWQFFKGYAPERFSLQSGALILAADGMSSTDTSVMACIAGDRSYTVELDIEIERGCEAGLILFYNQPHSLGLVLSSNGIGNLRNGSLKDVGVATNRATFRIVNDQQEVDMYYRSPDQPWVHLRETVDITCNNDNALGDFLDVRPALYAAGTNHALFRSFRYISSAVPPESQ